MNARLNLWTFVGLVAGLITPDVIRPWVLLWALGALFWWLVVMLRRKAASYMLIPALAIMLSGCAGTDKAMVYTEEGLRGAEQGWDAYYNAEANRCEKLHEPKSPGMEVCLGETYDTDAAVAVAVTTAVGLLRTYWIARAAGEKPDFAKVLTQVKQLVEDLPPQAKTFFDRVKGIP